MEEKLRKVSRRSFLGQVAGGAAGVGALAVVGGSAAQAGDAPTNDFAKPDGGGGDKLAQGCSDSDTGRYADGIGHGRNCRPNYGQNCTDGDTGRYGDPVGRGRNCGGRRPRRQESCSDRDTGRGADPIGRGRRCAGRTYTGVTDNDSGPGRDPANYGRRGRNNGSCSDSDSGRYGDEAGHGRNC